MCFLLVEGVLLRKNTGFGITVLLFRGVKYSNTILSKRVPSVNAPVLVSQGFLNISWHYTGTSWMQFWTVMKKKSGAHLAAGRVQSVWKQVGGRGHSRCTQLGSSTSSTARRWTVGCSRSCPLCWPWSAWPLWRERATSATVVQTGHRSV